MADPLATPSSLAVIALPFSFTQEKLLRASQFVKEAKEHGITLTKGDLDSLHLHRLLIPFFRIDEAVAAQYEVPIDPDDHGTFANYAREGSLRDPASESFLPGGDYLYSVWQILLVAEALNARTWLDHASVGKEFRQRAATRRRLALALSALTTKHLPSIVGEVKYPSGTGVEALRSSNLGILEAVRLEAAGFDPSDLLAEGEMFIHTARASDPLRDWWGLLRHSDHTGWFKLRGAAKHALWQRLAAEVLFRAHEALAEAGDLDPIPDVSDAKFWSPHHDRISTRSKDADSLNQALGRLGLSPHPRVLVVVEGDTEMEHVPALLGELGISSSNKVRVVNQQTSNRSPQELALYAVAPRIGQPRRGGHRMDTTPTALVVAMDPENLWRSAASQAKEERTLRAAIRRAVELQGAHISDDELDVLVTVYTWGDHKYELANFTDEELTAAISDLAVEQGLEISLEWATRLKTALFWARSKRSDIKVIFPKVGMKTEKVRLSQRLTPILLAKQVVEARESRPARTPVIELAFVIHDLVSRLGGGNYLLGSVQSEQ